MARRFRIVGLDVAPGAAVSVLGAPLGSVITDGLARVSITQERIAVDVSRWHLGQLELQLPLETPLPVLQALVLPASSDAQLRKRFTLHLEALLERQLLVYGLPAGAVLTDGANYCESKSEEDCVSLLHWNLAALILFPPKGWHNEIALRIESCGTDLNGSPLAGLLRIRLVSANAYLQSRTQNTKKTVDSEFKLNFGELQQEPAGGQLTIHTHAANTAFSSAGLSDIHLDEAALQLLEAKFRLH
ncbi:MAG: hypothetical protein U1F46_10990 [Marinagarivorans sp.]